MSIRTVALPATLLLLAACSDTALAVVCPGEAAPAIVVSVVDQARTRSIADQASGWYRVGTQTDSLRHRSTSGDEALLALGPAGTYRVEVLVDGHSPWRADAVEVADGTCGVRTVRLEAAPVPL